ncbi:prenyltransferase/squalene oxidase repeat-containing protein [Luteolibacter sp. LG18]|uniref:prenyltransferase/squalene oxidase repeat-containing protein n=1 Tax=Luteolibacter sp. LG18 TaxID=2819286 RepID=UPI002B31985B|nr:cycloartenol synthase [Luteolibacter sp. LG18]
MKATVVFSILAAGIAAAADSSDRYTSVQQEIKQAIARGNAWLKTQQKEDGHWDDEGLPALTALALTAATRDPNVDVKKQVPDHLAKGYDWLVKQQKEDGGIYNRGLSTYNTATSITALVALGKDGYEPAIVKARKHLIGQQWDTGEKGKTDNPNDGGVGYGAGTNKDHDDLSNTWLAIEAISLSANVVADGKHGDQPDLDWKAAQTFLSRCQNLSSVNDQPWVSEDDKNKGGFVYSPTGSKAEDILPDGKKALRSYGSMSYAGLLSMIYAKVGADDPRVKAVKEWLGKNYTVSENPGLGTSGQYYYYQTMTKALSAANLSTLKLADGKEADWRKDVADKLLSLQQGDGSWKNTDGKWMESNPVLVTAYSILALEQVYYAIPNK